MQTIGRGLTLAAQLPPPIDVRVGEGSYPEKVTMIEGVNILGGYDCSPLPCSATRDPTMNHSMIVDQDFEGVLAPSTITRATTLDGLEMTGKAGTPSGLYGAALTVVGSPTLGHNVVTGGSITGSAKSSYGIMIPSPGSTSGPLIANNVISGGSGASAAGIVAYRAGTAILGNDIRAGSASAATGNAWGIVLNGGPIQVDSNRINTATSPGSCVSSTVWCGGIWSQSSDAYLTNNVVLGLAAHHSTALLAAEIEVGAPTLRVNSNYFDGAGLATLTSGSSSTAVTLNKPGLPGVNAIIGRLRNNVFRGGMNQFRYGVFEDAPAGKTVHPEKLENNNFFFPPLSGRTDVLYRFWNGTSQANYTTIAVMEANVLLHAMANFQADCMFSSTFHLVAGSLCINAGTSVEAPPLDFEGQARPNGGLFDVGPDEYYP